MTVINHSLEAVNDTSWQTSLLRQSLETFSALPEGAVADPGQGDSQDDWFPFERLAEEDFGDQVIGRIAEQTSADDRVSGTYTLRYATYYPLLLAGYLFAREKRVPVLSGNVWIANREWLNQFRLLEPAVIALPDDPIATEPGCVTVQDESQLAEALFEQMTRMVGPTIEAWSARKIVPRANAWAGVVDWLAYGFQMAGRHAVGLDTSWAQWEQVIEGRVFPVRRRPRRFIFNNQGERDELLIRSGCCLWFTQPAARNGDEVRYCASCYIEHDEKRLEQILGNQRS